MGKARRIGRGEEKINWEVKYRGIGLYLFLLWPVVGILGGIVELRWDLLLFSVWELLLFIGVVLLSKKGFKAEWEYQNSPVALPLKFPFKVGASLLLGIGVFSTLKFAGVEWDRSLIGLVAGTGGYLLWYGPDPLTPKLPAGLREKEIGPYRELLGEGRRELEKLERLSRKIQEGELARELKVVLEMGRELIRRLEERPGELTPIHRPLILLFQVVRETLDSYLRLPPSERRNRELEFIGILKGLEERVAGELSRLKREDLVDFDINIELIRRQLFR
ncbi:MAG: 5-bromo-4-chloroindolyl phosphate hydrolysis family protein [Campylobacterales bacterium]